MSLSSKRESTMSLDQPLPNLKSALLESIQETRPEVEKAYKSGASYKGQVLDNKKFGRGIFVWPNGDRYEGDYVENMRHGEGIQHWADGSKYQGTFVSDARHGRGQIMWANGEVYTGTFFRDRRHGPGLYEWPDNSSFKGTFFMDKKEGYGSFTFSNGNVFYGLYKMDEREGPGVLRYTDDRADVGLWHREKLVRLCTNIDGMFKMEDHPELDFNPEEAIEYIQHKGIKPENREDLLRPIAEPPSLFDYAPNVYPLEEMRSVFTGSLDPRSMAVDLKAFEEQFFQDPDGYEDIFGEEMLEASARLSQCGDAVSEVSLSGSKSGESIASQPLEPQVVESEMHADPDVHPSIEKLEKEKENHKRQGSAASQGSVPTSPKPSGLIQDRPLSRVSVDKVSVEGSVKNASVKSGSIARSGSAKSIGSLKGSQKSAVIKDSESRLFQTDSSSTIKQMENLDEQPPEKIKCINATPSSVAMQRHILNHRARENRMPFDVQKILVGDRCEHGPKGPIELASEELFKAALEGKPRKVRQLLHSGQAYEDVADKHGHTPLLAASVNWHLDVVNSLLDNGADVNRLNDEGISPLAACHIEFYPSEYFKYNIAEKGLIKPADFQQEKIFLPTTSSQALNIQSAKRKEKREKTPEKKIDTKKIEKIKQEYASIPKEENEKKDDNEKTRIDSGVSVDSGIPNTATDFESTIPQEEAKTPARTLGSLQIKRVNKVDVVQMLLPALDPEEGYMSEIEALRASYSDLQSQISDFESMKSVRNLKIDVTNQLIERCATELSMNEMVVDRERSANSQQETLGTARRLAIDKSERILMEKMIKQLLQRGADPNASKIPMPVLFFAIKSGDVEAVRLLLLKGAKTSTRLPSRLGGLSPLHIACAIPGDEGPQITELLLHSLADPDARADEDESYLNRTLEEEWGKDPIEDDTREKLGGRTPLHIACSRDDNYKNANKVVHLLLDHHANPDVLCNGHSPLSLAVASGNDLAIAELLHYNADPNLKLPFGIGSALCAAANTDYEQRREPSARLTLIDNLIAAGADILAPIPIGPKRQLGTAVDYAYYVYNLDRRIAHMPYHALSHAERETYNARRKLLAHLGMILRNKAVAREKQRLEEEEKSGRRSISPSSIFLYTGAGLPHPRKGHRGSRDSHVSFDNDPRAKTSVDKSMSRGYTREASDAHSKKGNIRLDV